MTKTTLILTSEEKVKLDKLYGEDGAWTKKEATKILGKERLRELIEAKFLGAQDTEMGSMYQLLGPGRRAMYGIANEALSFGSQLDTAYVRLCMAELGWRCAEEDTQGYQGFDQLVPSLNFMEAETHLGRVLLGGRLIGGGYGRLGISRVAKRLRSSALHHNFLVVILTPHRRKGQKLSETHQSFLRVVHHLPKTSEIQRGRFAPPLPNTKEKTQGPFITPDMAATIRQKPRPLTDMTLDILQLVRKDRIELARQELDTDQALSRLQLMKFYGLNLSDLPNIFVTTALLRPIKNNGNQEVYTQLITTKKSRHLSDTDLIHRVTTAQIRLRMNVPVRFPPSSVQSSCTSNLISARLVQAGE